MNNTPNTQGLEIYTSTDIDCLVNTSEVQLDLVEHHSHPIVQNAIKDIIGLLYSEESEEQRKIRFHSLLGYLIGEKIKRIDEEIHDKLEDLVSEWGVTRNQIIDAIKNQTNIKENNI